MNNINSPNELLNFMSNNIEYGYLSKTGKLYHTSDKDYDSKWFSEYKLQNVKELLNNHCGNCWDQVELEREWFTNHNYEIKTIYEMVELNYENNYPTHSFLIYKDNNKYYWFENSDYNNRGIHTFDNFDELIKYQYNKYLELLKELNIKSNEVNNIVLKEFNKPKSGITASEYIEHVMKSKTIKLNKKYELTKCNNKDINRLIEYKKSIILEYAENISKEELEEINNYVNSSVLEDINNYFNIVLDNKIIGSILISKKDDGILLDEIYLEKEYRNKGNGTSIIKDILNDNNKVCLWVYKLNTVAVDLYKKLGFNITSETKTRYFMEYIK